MRKARFSQPIDLYEPTDVLVVGGGPAGLGAAIGAARSGAKTRLVERFGSLGGNMTNGGVAPCMTSYSLDGSTQLVRGVFDEFIRRLEARGAAVHPSRTGEYGPYSGYIGTARGGVIEGRPSGGWERVTPFDPEAARLTAFEMCEEAGVELFLHTFAGTAMAKDGIVENVVAMNKDGLVGFPAQVIIDCTADADIAVAAGAQYRYGRDQDGLAQPMTMMFRIGGVDDAAVQRYQDEHPDDYWAYESLCEQARRVGRFPISRRGVILLKTLEPGVWWVNTSRIQGLDGSDARDLSAAEVIGRKQVDQLIEFFRSTLPGLEYCHLIDVASVVGVRETRRIVGDYVLSIEDVASGTVFADTIALSGYPMDIHAPTGLSESFDETRNAADAYGIPYRALLPVGLQNVIVAGRCISASHEALAALRVMPPVMAIGEGAGTAAALAIETHRSVRAIDIDELRQRIVNNGGYLGDGVVTDRMASSQR